MSHYKGRHIFLDFINFYNDDLDDCCQYVFNLMRSSLANTTMKNMHDRMVILRGPNTEEGFTSVILLDESHITAHAYTKQGLLALDVFTCGITDPKIISNYIKEGLEKKYPNIRCSNHQLNKRFIHLF